MNITKLFFVIVLSFTQFIGSRCPKDFVLIGINLNLYSGDNYTQKNIYTYVPENYIDFYKTNIGFDGEQYAYIIYSDSSTIYFSNEFLSTTYPNKDKLYKMGVRGYSYNNILTDSIVHQGIDENELYWKEIAHNGIVVGYANVQSKMKCSFEKAMGFSFKKSFWQRSIKPMSGQRTTKNRDR